MCHSTLTDYLGSDDLRNEQAAPVKHQCVDGEVFAMAGGSKQQGTPALSPHALRRHPRGQPRGVWMPNMRVRRLDAAYSLFDARIRLQSQGVVGAEQRVLDGLADDGLPSAMYASP